MVWKNEGKLFKEGFIDRGMFGVLDVLHLARREFIGIEEPKCEKEYLPARNGMPTVAAFFPSALMQGGRLGDTILSRARGKGYGLIARAISSGALSPSPSDMRGYLDRVYDGLLGDIRERGLKNKELISCGVSMGCSPASRLSGEFGMSKMLLVAPGDRLAESFIESAAMASISVEAWSQGRQPSEFVKALEVYDPIKYVPVFSGRACIHVAPHDYVFIPSCRGKALANAFLAEAQRRKDLSVVVYYPWGYDHTSLILKFVRDFGEMVKPLIE